MDRAIDQQLPLYANGLAGKFVTLLVALDDNVLKRRSFVGAFQSAGPTGSVAFLTEEFLQWP
jgi:hypothetical protein